MTKMTKVAVIGSGNIGTDLMRKIQRIGGRVEIAALVGVDPASEGLALARQSGVSAVSDGIEGLIALPEFQDVEYVFDATSAGAHARHDSLLRLHGKRIIDLTPAAIGPFCVPVVNGEAHRDAPNVNMVTCGGQATTPIVAAVNQVAKVRYAEIVASISSRSAGPGTRANIDEFTQTTARALEMVGGAERGKAIIVLNPAEPPLIMRDTVYCLSDPADPEQIRRSVREMVWRVAAYVPGYRLKQEILVEQIGAGGGLAIPGVGPFVGMKTSVFLEVEGAGDFLPKYAGNLDIMTSAALAVVERMIEGARA
ncbi:acetaldehyde dehydrogenase [Bradyrhizobium elkanii]|uniref:acetaldehyde dehydrogenase (acetylating) n=1 Tax=Bradyrhizobium elkanii TaxID=29448 RepID=UPI0035176358